ncbi:hypothetical protein DAI22_04g016600 [Oryza sativa Japonica Group]|nr:hypothetical protein DAI22_04g016600 [Oryza sativa Japonica Group]
MAKAIWRKRSWWPRRWTAWIRRRNWAAVLWCRSTPANWPAGLWWRSTPANLFRRSYRVWRLVGGWPWWRWGSW